MNASRFESGLRTVIMVVVGGIGGAVGFHHTMQWADENGQTGWVSLGVAVVIECMAIVAGFELRRAPGLFPGLVLVVAFVIQMIAQVSQARPTAAGWLLAATPALGFLVIVKLAMRRTHRNTTAPASAPLPVTADRVGQSPPVEQPAVVAELPAGNAYQAAEQVQMSWPPKV